MAIESQMHLWAVSMPTLLHDDRGHHEDLRLCIVDINDSENRAKQGTDFEKASRLEPHDTRVMSTAK